MMTLKVVDFQVTKWSIEQIDVIFFMRLYCYLSYISS